MRGRLAISILLILGLVLFLPAAASAAYAWEPTGGPPVSGNPVTCLTLDEAHGILYAGADTGEVYRYQAGAWSSTGGPSAQTRINDIEYDPVSNTLVAALYVDSSFQVWTYQEGGAWSLTNGTVGNDNPGSVASDGAQKKLYAATYGGATWVYDYQSAPGPWASIGDPLDGIQCLKMDTERHVLYAGGSLGTAWPPDAAVSRYDGVSWTSFGSDFGTYAKSVRSMTLDSTRNILYAGIYVGDQTGEVNVFRRNVGAGGDWVGIGTLCGGPEIYSLAVDEVNDTLYALAWDGHVYKNCNASTGSTWIDIGLVSENTQYNLGLQYDPGDATLYCGSNDGQVYSQGIPAVTSLAPSSGGQGQTLDVEISATGAPFTAASEAVFSGDGVNVNSTTLMSAGRVRANVTIEPDTYLGPRNVWVKTGSDKTNRLVDGFTVTERSTLSTWYLAEGTNAWGFNTYITLENPNNQQLTAKLTYMNPNPPATGNGIVATRTVTLPPLSQTSVSSEPDIGSVDFSTKVECLQGKPIAVDRTMFWTGEGAAVPGYHSSIGAIAPSRTWYLPEGSSAWGFETWTLVLNPNPEQANVTITYMTEDMGPVISNKVVPANSRATFSMSTDAGASDASIKVESDRAVVAERSMYRNGRREGSCSVGSSLPAADYFLAEGATGYAAGFTTYVLVQNPQDAANDVALTYQTQSGEVAGPTFTMAPNSRKTVRLNDQLPPDTNVSTHVRGTKPLVAERAMYWDNGTGEAFHASVGLSAPHMSFLLPDGQSSNGCETWTTVANPNPGSVTVRVTCLPQGGGESITFTDEIPQGIRRTYNMADRLPAGRASILVQSLDGARPVIVERAMYWNSQAGGSSTIGGYSDFN